VHPPICDSNTVQAPLHRCIRNNMMRSPYIHEDGVGTNGP
jgi:hypothetical protein